MKKAILLIAAAFLLMPSLAAASGEEVLKEKVEVVNVEVPVRVFLKGQPVDNLSKNDFILSEGDDVQTINGFYVRRKKMVVHKVTMETENGNALLPSRYFVLVFRILDYNDQVRKGVDYIFKNILRDNDQLLVMINDRTLLLNQDIWQVKRHELLDEVLQEESHKAKRELEQFFQLVQKDLDQTKLGALLQRDGNFYPPNIINFLDRYLRTWIEFKKKYLLPDLDKFYNFSTHLEKIKKEKWVLSFFQFEMFPKMKLSGEMRQQIDQLLDQLKVARSEDVLHAQLIDNLLEKIDRELNMAGDFPVDEVSKMMIKVDTTYHCFLMGVERDSFSEDLEYKKVASDIENSLREITRRSGGEIMFSGDIRSALHTLEEREDVYYVLTYVPRHPLQKEKIRVKLANPDYQLFYDDNIRADYIGDYFKRKQAENPTVQLASIAFDRRELRLEISDFKMVPAEKGKHGQLNVAVRVLDEQNQQLYDRNRSFSTKEAQASVGINFSFLKSGKYMFLVEVRDLLSGRAAMDALQAEVN
jgi:hypothetical protein